MIITIAEVTCFILIEEQEPCLYRKIEKKRVVHSPTWHELVKWKQFNTKMTHSKTKPNPLHFTFALSINFLGNVPSPMGNVMLPFTHERNAPTCFGKVRNISKQLCQLRNFIFGMFFFTLWKLPNSFISSFFLVFFSFLSKS